MSHSRLSLMVLSMALILTQMSHATPTCDAKWSGCVLTQLSWNEADNHGLACYESNETNRLRGYVPESPQDANTLFVSTSAECGDQWDIEKVNGQFHLVSGTKVDNFCGGSKILDTATNPCNPPADD